MANLRLFETPIQTSVSFKQAYPSLEQLLQNASIVINYFRVYTVNATTVILTKSNQKNLVVLFNKQTKITEDEISLVKEQLLDNAETKQHQIPKDRMPSEYTDVLLIEF